MNMHIVLTIIMITIIIINMSIIIIIISLDTIGMGLVNILDFLRVSRF